MHDPADIDIIARRIAWAHWKALNPADVCRDDLHLWECLGDHHRSAYRAAALEVASL
jgi:hypothetical protein